MDDSERYSSTCDVCGDYSCGCGMNDAQLLDNVDLYIKKLKERGYGDRDRLFRKLIEEAGEYGEAIEFSHGSTRKKAKFKDEDPKEKLCEEAADIVMVALAISSLDDIGIRAALNRIIAKLSIRQKEHDERWKIK